MKITGEVKIKENITDFDLGDVIETAVPFIIRETDKGMTYTPYYGFMGIRVGIAKHLLDGVQFDDSDAVLDKVYENDGILNVIDTFMSNNSKEMIFITKNIDDIVEFEKQKSIYDFSDIKERLLKCIAQEKTLNDLAIKYAQNQNKLISQQIKANEFNEKVMEHTTPEDAAKLNRMLLSGEFDVNKMAEIAVEKYLDSDVRKNNENTIMDITMQRNLTPITKNKKTTK